MSKTFKSALSTDKELRITGGPERVCFAQRAHNGMESFVFIDNTEAPALALAILEAAGFKAEFHATGTFQDGDCWQLENVAQTIKDYLSIKDAEAAEAEAQAELEAEALELMNVRLQASGTRVHLTKATVDPVALEGWLAVARRAREINKENQ